MGLKFNYNYWNELEVPSFILCKMDKKRIGKLKCSERKLTWNNEIPTISFKIQMMLDGEKNQYYDFVKELQYILLEDIGTFQITSISTTSTGTDFEYKTVTAQSIEIELGQKYLNTFVINMGTTESIDDIKLYNPIDIKHSLLHLILEKCPSWSIGYVEPELWTMKRSFEIDEQDVYSFLMENMSTAFDAIFTFNTIDNEINAYKKDSVSKNTDVVVSFKNLAKEITLEPNIDNIKTCVTLLGDDDLTVRELNLGNDKIYNFDYFLNTDYMNEELISAIKKYKEKYLSASKSYAELIQKYNKDGLILNYYQNSQFPMQFKNSSSNHTSGDKFPTTTSTNYSNLKNLYEQYISYSSITDINDKNYIIDDTPKYIGTNWDNHSKYIDNLVSHGLISSSLANEMIKEYQSSEEKSLAGTDKKYIDYTEEDFLRFRLDELNKLVKHENEVDGNITKEGGIKAAIQLQQSLYMDKGYGELPKGTETQSEQNTKIKNYYNFYYKTVLCLQYINNVISIKEKQLDTIKTSRNETYIKMQEVQKQADIKEYFTNEQWNTLSRFIRETTLNESNYTVTDSMSAEEALEMKQSFLDFGNKEIQKVSQPEFSFKMTMANIFALQDFKDHLNDFNIYNYITIYLRDDYYVRAKILSFTIDFEDKSSFDIEFGSVYKYSTKNIWDTAIDAMQKASSASTSVSFNRFNWNKADENANDIQSMISDGLLNAGATFKNSRSTFNVDDRGIFMSKEDDSNIGAALTGSNLLFTTDGWNTVRSSLGKISYTDNTGTKHDDYGLIAEAVLAGYVYGSYISGSTIYGDSIIGGSITGTTFNNGNGTFSVDSNGYIKASSGKIGGWDLTNDSLYTGDITKEYSDNTVRLSSTTFSNGYHNNLRFAIGSKFAVTSDGTLYASGGSIGGWTVDGNTLLSSNSNLILDAGNSNIRSNKTSLLDGNTGFYIGTDGISLGASGAFVVDNSGSLTAKSGNIGGWNLYGGVSTRSIKRISGNSQYLQAGSTKLSGNGSMENTNGTWSIDSNGNASFSNITITGGNIGMGGATIDANGWDFSGLLSSASGLNTGVNFGGVSLSSHISIGDSNTLSAAKVYADEIVANKVTAAEVNSMIGKFGYVTANDISADYVQAKISELNFLKVGALFVGTEGLLSWQKVKDINGKTIKVLGR